MSKKYFQTPEERFKRYQRAAARFELWRGMLEEAYEFALPVRDMISDKTQGQEKSRRVYDDTAIVSVQDFASNLQSALIPPYRRWAELKASEFSEKLDISSDEKDLINKELDNQTNVLFDYLNASNMHLEMNIVFQDLAIGSGAFMINEGNLDQPISFMSIPINECGFEVNENNDPENFWWSYEIEAALIPKKFPEAKLTNEIQTKIKENNGATVKLIQGCICYSENPPESRYFYYIQTHNKEDIYTEFKDYNPFNLLRFAVCPGETYGRGPVIQVLPSIRKVNKMEECKLRTADLIAYPMYTVKGNAVLNAYNLRLQPGALIDVGAAMGPGKAIEPIEGGGNAEILRSDINEFRQNIKDALFSNPLGNPGDNTNQTATEISIRQQNWIRKNGAAVARINKGIEGILSTAIKILRKKGLLTDIQIGMKRVTLDVDNKMINIKYASPMLRVQDMDDVQRIQTFFQFLQSNYNPAAPMLVTNLTTAMPYFIDKFGVDARNFNSSMEIAKAISGAMQQIQNQNQQLQDQPTLPTGQ